MDRSALRYIERQKNNSQPVESVEATGDFSAKLMKLKQEQADLIEFTALMEGKITSESYLRRKVLPFVRIAWCINSILMCVCIPQARLFFLFSIPVVFLWLRFAAWTSLRREFGRQLYPFRTAIGAVFIPGWFKYES